MKNTSVLSMETISGKPRLRREGNCFYPIRSMDSARSDVSQINEYELWERVIDERSGKPRLKTARNFFNYMTQDKIPLLVEAYNFWRDFDEYLLLEGTHFKTEERKWVAVKCSKRGNDVYGERVQERLRFLKWAEKLTFFSPKDFDTKKSIKTRLLWVTLTWNSNLCDLKEAWESCEYFYNLFITNLRNRYGEIQVLKFPQASPGKKGKAFGYPHFHLILLFQDQEFTVFPWLKDDKSFEYRIHEREDLRSQGKWHSYIDIKAISSMQGVYNYAVKHHENAGFGNSEDAVLNNAMCWLFKKKSYTISGSFRESYREFIIYLRKSKTFQLTLDGEKIPVWSWKLVGFYSWEKLCKFKKFDSSPPWFIRFSKDEIANLFDSDRNY